MKYTCVIVDDERTARNILKRYISEVGYLELIAECKNGIEALEIINRESVDIVLLDIEMPKLTGLSLIKTLRHSPDVIITTAYREFAIDGFELNVKDYLLKPISFERFLTAISKVISNQKTVNEPSRKAPEYTYFKSGKKNVRVCFTDILYIEGLSNYVKIHTLNGVIVTYKKLSDLATDLPYDDFIRIHRSYIVARSKITSYANDSLEIGKQQLSIGNTYKESFFDKMSEV